MDENKPIIIITAVTLGLPALIAMVLLASNPGIGDGVGSALTLIAVMGTFISGWVFEVIRLAELPDEGTAN